MDLKEIRQLIKIVETSNISGLEIEEEGYKVKISKSSNNVDAGAHQIHTVAVPQVQAAVPVATPPTATPAPEQPAEKSSSNRVEVHSPMVGTFYRSPSPDSDPYVDMGKKIKSGDVLCIIEAMKLMNEIEAEVAGTIVEINVENGQPVEYNQVLFVVEKD